MDIRHSADSQVHRYFFSAPQMLVSISERVVSVQKRPSTQQVRSQFGIGLVVIHEGRDMKEYPPQMGHEPRIIQPPEQSMNRPQNLGHCLTETER